jgi:hypothetical protein
MPSLSSRHPANRMIGKFLDSSTIGRSLEKMVGFGLALLPCSSAMILSMNQICLNLKCDNFFCTCNHYLLDMQESLCK